MSQESLVKGHLGGYPYLTLSPRLFCFRHGENEEKRWPGEDPEVPISAIYGVFRLRKKLRYKFHILNRDRSLLTVTINLLSSPPLNICKGEANDQPMTLKSLKRLLARKKMIS